MIMFLFSFLSVSTAFSLALKTCRLGYGGVKAKGFNVAFWGFIDPSLLSSSSSRHSSGFLTFSECLIFFGEIGRDIFLACECAIDFISRSCGTFSLLQLILRFAITEFIFTYPAIESLCVESFVSSLILRFSSDIWDYRVALASANCCWSGF